MRRRGTVLLCVLGDCDVRRVEMAFSAFNLAEYGVWVSVLVYAFESGGAAATAVVAVAQLLPAALIAPVLARSVDRRGPTVALRHGYWFQSAALGATSLLLLMASPHLLVYPTAIVAAVAVTVTRPAQAALMPELVHDAESLTAVNVLSGWVESLSVLTGPALAGVLIALDGPGAAVGAFALGTICAALLVTGIPARKPSPARTPADSNRSVDLRHTVSAIRAHEGLTALITMLGVQFLVIGMLDVLMVVLAISALGLGASGAAYLNAALGAGAVLGSVAAVWLIGRRRLTSPLVAAALGWALLLAVLGAWPSAVGAFLLLSGAGGARSVLDISGRTMLLRAAPATLRGRIFGLLEGLSMLGLAIGSSLASLLVAAGGPATALVATSALLCAVTLLAAAQIKRLENNSEPPGLLLSSLPDADAESPLDINQVPAPAVAVTP